MLPTLLQKRCILLLHDFHWNLCKLSTRKGKLVLCSNCLGRLKRKEKRLAKQSGLQSRKQRQTLFAQRGQVAPNTRTGLCALCWLLRISFENRAGNSNVSNSLSICPMERWSGKNLTAPSATHFLERISEV